jgi:hypothetical protein
MPPSLCFISEITGLIYIKFGLGFTIKIVAKILLLFSYGEYLTKYKGR